MLKEAGETYKDPSVHYKEKICKSNVPATHEATLKPRNPRQIKNAQAQAQKIRRYTQGVLFNLVELTHGIQDYTHRMFLVPGLEVVFGNRAMLQEFQAVLCTEGQQPQLVSYDTTYNLGIIFTDPTGPVGLARSENYTGPSLEGTSYPSVNKHLKVIKQMK